MKESLCKEAIMVKTAKGGWLQALGQQIKEEKGEVNMVAIVLIILVVLGLVVIFRDQLTQLLGTLFDKIQQEALTI